MGKIIKYITNNIRLCTQILFAALSNGYVKGFAEGKIYKGKTKALCVPGLNCYSCPGALGSCPIGSLQAVINSRNYKFAFYVVGFLIMFGAFWGRFVCGWLCPFGLVQDLIHKIPFPKKYRKIKGDKYLKYLKYIILLVFVIILPIAVLDIVGQGSPWFCKLICPSGTLLAGIPLVIANESFRASLGWLFVLKNIILISIVLISVVVYRPFCRYLCPLGAIYGLFNPVALYRYNIDKDKCVMCKKCQKVCKLDIPVYDNPNSTECIRCGNCKKSCPQGAIRSSFDKTNKNKKF